MAIEWLTQSGSPKMEFRIAPGVDRADINYSTNDAKDYAIKMRGLGTGQLIIYAAADYADTISVYKAKRPVENMTDAAAFAAIEWHLVGSWTEAGSAGLSVAIKIDTPEEAILIRFGAGNDTEERGAYLHCGVDRRHNPAQAH